MRRLGPVSLATLPATAPSGASAHAMAGASAFRTMFNRRVPAQFGAASYAAQLARTLRVPTTRSTNFATQSTPSFLGFLGFNGIDAFDAATLNGGDIEPPDQGLCAGNGEVIEMVNLALSVFDTRGQLTAGPTDLNAFFGVPASDFLSDPRCVYDSVSNTFFLSITDLPTPSTSALLLAVLPASGATGAVYELDTTDDGTNGTPDHPNCPCLNDQPLLGVDANGVYLSANEFEINVSNPSASTFNGAQIYAFNKANLVSETPIPAIVLFGSPLSIGGALAASVQPANAPDGHFATANGGTEYFLSALDFAGRLDNRIGLWALTDTCGLPSSTGTPACGAAPTLRNTVLRSETYGFPPFEGNNSSAPGATQQSGPTPLGAANGGTLELLATNDDRMNQVVYAGGELYGGLNTVISVRGGTRGNSEAGVAYFVVKPTLNKRGLGGRVVKQGYVAHMDTNVFYPSIGVTSSGKAVITFSLSGPSLFPSAGYMPLAKKAQISIMGAGAAPDDGFTGYDVAAIQFTSLSPGVGRWGDYSAAVADGDQVWIAAEYIPFACDAAQYAVDPTCGGRRGQFSNWGTFIGALTFPPAR
ncbi:MAG: hypothetical protein ACREQN_09955 [Candidatus Binataceae bacterium]